MQNNRTASVKVEIDRLAKSYVPGKPILRPIELAIEPGELFFLLGPSGCGKSTLLRILAGLVKPDGGAIRFNGVDVTDFAPEKRQAAMVFQSYALWPHLSVFENVAFGLRSAGADAAVIRTEVAAALELVQLADCAERKIPSLSGGQQQRVALARALAVRPAVLLLDEPLSNLDARLRDAMRCEIRRITKERGLTAIYVTHDRREALSMADRIAVLADGLLQQVGDPEAIYRRPANRFVASFLGDANFISGVILDRHDGVTSIDTGLGLLQSSLPHDFAVNAPVTVMIRPESFRFREGGSGAVNEIEAELYDGAYLGDHREWKLRAGSTPLEVNESSPPSRQFGKRYHLAVTPDHVVLLDGEK